MLFVLGGLVRITGSGMGCPDWPKCFGSYIPPTHESQLPENYQEYFLEKRMEKTDRLIALLDKIGASEKAREIENYEYRDQKHEFNVYKAYTEYINRLWGALTGIIVLLAMVSSFRLFKTDRRIVMYSVLGFASVMINAFLGAIVVNANLLGNIVTIHFLAAFAAISFFMLARIRMIKPSVEGQLQILKLLSISMMIILIAQIVFGTQIREVIDHRITIVSSVSAQIFTLEELAGTSFLLHRVLGLLILILAGIQWYVSRGSIRTSKLYKLSLLILGLAAAQILFGSFIVEFTLESISKLFHITFGASLFVAQFYICAVVWTSTSNQKQIANS